MCTFWMCTVHLLDVHCAPVRRCVLEEGGAQGPFVPGRDENIDLTLPAGR